MPQQPSPHTFQGRCLGETEERRPTKRVETDQAYGRAAHPQDRWAAVESTERTEAVSEVE
jgi:hypothetical protein